MNLDAQQFAVVAVMLCILLITYACLYRWDENYPNDQGAE